MIAIQMEQMLQLQYSDTGGLKTPEIIPYGNKTMKSLTIVDNR